MKPEKILKPGRLLKSCCQQEKGKTLILRLKMMYLFSLHFKDM